MPGPRLLVRVHCTNPDSHPYAYLSHVPDSATLGNQLVVFGLVRAKFWIGEEKEGIISAEFKLHPLTPPPFSINVLAASLKGSGALLRLCLNSIWPSSSNTRNSLRILILLKTLLVVRSWFTRYCCRNSRVWCDSKDISEVGGVSQGRHN